MLFSLMLMLFFFMSIILNKFQLMFFFSFLGFLLIFMMTFFIEEFSYCFLSLNMFSDYLSMILLILSFFLNFFILMHTYNYKNKSLFFIMNSMFMILFLCFFSNNLLSFYIFFELSLVPLFFLMMICGSSEERYSASLYLMMYTLTGSLLFLMIIMFMKNYNMNFNLMNNHYYNNSQSLIYMIMMLIFLIKSPLFGLHMWLSKAHVEAPVMGSMMLAGILLKLGGFGMYRIIFFTNMNKMMILFNYLIFISMIGAVLVCMICMRQIDIKLLIAYSSVSHMGLVLASMMNMNKLSWSGSAGMMLAHGFCSSSLFFMANMLYIRCSSRNLLMMKSVLNYFPMFMLLWMMMSIFNMGTPPSLNFFCELILIMSILKKSILLSFIIFFYLMMVVYYSITLFMSTSHGNKLLFFKLKKENFNEMFIVTSHLLFLLLFLLKPSIFIINF